MSYPQDYYGRRSGRSITSVPDAAGLPYEPFLHRELDQQNVVEADAYRPPLNPAPPYLNRVSSHQTSSHLSSRGESPLFSPTGSCLSNTTADTAHSSPLAGHDAPVSDGHVKQESAGVYVRGATCSVDRHEFNRVAPEGERRHSLRRSAPLPSAWARSGHGAGHQETDKHPSGSSSRRQRDQEPPVFEDDEDDLHLEGHRNPAFPPELPPMSSQRRNMNSLAGVGEHLEYRQHHSDTRVRDIDPRIYGNSNEDGRGYRGSGSSINRSPELMVSSMASSMASLIVHQGSAPGFVPLLCPPPSCRANLKLTQWSQVS